MKMYFKIISIIGFVLLLTQSNSSLAAPLNMRIGKNNNSNQNKTPRQDDDITLERAIISFAQIAKKIRTDYVEPISYKKLLDGALKGMLKSLDPHSDYLEPRGFKSIQEGVSGQFGGIGLELTWRNNALFVIAPMDDSPSKKAGIQSGDYIIKIEGTKTTKLDFRKAINMMRGKVGTKLKLTLYRQNKGPFDVEVTREIIKIHPVRWELKENNTIGYIRIASFISTNTGEEVINAIKKIKAKAGNNIKGYILDLRDNSGGLLTEAVQVADAFLKQGEIVSIRGRNQQQFESYSTSNIGDVTNGMPLVILINGGTASAPEIVAGALQDHGRALVVGEPSFGKGSVQMIIPLRNGGAIKMTTSRYYTPAGKSIQQLGITPNIQVSQIRNLAEINEDRLKEADLKGAIKNKDAKMILEKKKIMKNIHGIDIIDDYQLDRAIDILKAIYAIKQQKIIKTKKDIKMAKTYIAK